MGILPRTALITGGEILFNDPAGGERDLASAADAIQGLPVAFAATASA